MGRRKRLCITSTDLPEPVEDHEASETQGGQSNVQECRSFNQQSSINTQSSEHEIGIHEQGAPKKVRGYTHKAETWKMSNTQKNSCHVQQVWKANRG